MEQAFVTLNNKAYLILYIILYRFLILNYKFTVYGTIGAIYKKLLRNLACFLILNTMIYCEWNMDSPLMEHAFETVYSGSLQCHLYYWYITQA